MDTTAEINRLQRVFMAQGFTVAQALVLAEMKLEIIRLRAALAAAANVLDSIR